jgi:hypothetical protein
MRTVPDGLMITPDRVILDPPAENTQSPAGLRLNAELAATVTRVLSARQVQLAIAGERILADTCLELQPGSRLQLKVIRTDPRPVLKILETVVPQDAAGMPAPKRPPLAGDPFAGLSRLLSAGQEGGGEGLARLTGLIASLAVKSAAPDAALLERLMLNAGMLWEAKVSQAVSRRPAPAPEGLRQMTAGDLKAAALQLLQEAAGGPGARAGVQHFLEGLETLQILNRHAAEETGRFILPLPVLWDDGLRFGQLLLDFNREAGGEGPSAEKATRLSLLLTLSRLGPLRGDFAIWRKTVNGTFGVADAGAAQLVGSELPRLTRALGRIGFSVGRIDCRVLGLATLAGTSLAEEVLGAPESGLNLVV